jgi:hypothetical protein
VSVFPVVELLRKLNGNKIAQPRLEQRVTDGLLPLCDSGQVPNKAGKERLQRGDNLQEAVKAVI